MNLARSKIYIGQTVFYSSRCYGAILSVESSVNKDTFLINCKDLGQTVRHSPAMFQCNLQYMRFTVENRARQFYQMVIDLLYMSQTWVYTISHTFKRFLTPPPPPRHDRHKKWSHQNSNNFQPLNPYNPSWEFNQDEGISSRTLKYSSLLAGQLWTVCSLKYLSYPGPYTWRSGPAPYLAAFWFRSPAAAAR